MRCCLFKPTQGKEFTKNRQGKASLEGYTSEHSFKKFRIQTVKLIHTIQTKPAKSNGEKMRKHSSEQGVPKTGGQGVI